MKDTPQTQLQIHPTNRSGVRISWRSPIQKLAQKLPTFSQQFRSSFLEQQNTENPARIVPKIENPMIIVSKIEKPYDDRT